MPSRPLLSGVVATIAAMPRISEFYGIVIEMYFDDHPPPHFHARHGGDNAVISIEGELLAGSLPSRALRLVREWTKLHHAELQANWRRLESDETPRRIDPLP